MNCTAMMAPALILKYFHQKLPAKKNQLLATEEPKS
jgi:hypothetical protein